MVGGAAAAAGFHSARRRASRIASVARLMGLFQLM